MVISMVAWAHQLLDDLERNAPHGEVAAVGVAQVVPGDAPLLARDARSAQCPLQPVLRHPSGERLPVLLADVRRLVALDSTFRAWPQGPVRVVERRKAR